MREPLRDKNGSCNLAFVLAGGLLGIVAQFVGTGVSVPVGGVVVGVVVDGGVVVGGAVPGWHLMICVR